MGEQLLGKQRHIWGMYCAGLFAHQPPGGRLSILAHGHLGHSPAVPHGGAYKDPYSVGLTAQVESALEAVDAIKAAFPQSAIAVAGHSVGAWITLQVMKARPDTIASVFLLFPTIAHIAKTPNGHSLSWVFRSPLPRLISYASVLTRALPLRVLAMLFPDWPHTQVLVLRTLLHARSAVYASLSLAHEEMVTIRDLDATLLQEYSRRLHFYFAKSDGWVGQQKEDILKAFDAGSSSVKIVHGQADIPHSFCINHGEQLAQQCFEWLLSARLL